MSHPVRKTLVRAALCGAAGAAGLLGTASVAQAAPLANLSSDTEQADMVGDTVNGLGRSAVGVVNEAGADVAPHLQEGAKAGGALLGGVTAR
ncbi:hypothetical protein [Streptomyces sedi]|uniref:Secreted protein n=1 Tax=Streptomyces sedi TaxID=555059 RepID=A0A5C4VAD6_9ACTN|nr:hypothetical protein [Streptomyces sedi]TNM32807.1 hypothetical protein FH715_05705 [Streptomyces sedi]